MPNTWLKKSGHCCFTDGVTSQSPLGFMVINHQFNYTHSVLMNEQVKDFLDSAPGALSSLALAL